jgi:hypothetical protein
MDISAPFEKRIKASSWPGTKDMPWLVIAEDESTNNIYSRAEYEVIA